MKATILLTVIAAGSGRLLAACGGAATGGTPQRRTSCRRTDASAAPKHRLPRRADTIILGAYTTPREAYGKIHPALPGPVEEPRPART